MKQFRALTVVKHPRDDVFALVRDRMPELADSIADVGSVTVQSRQARADGAVELVNVWRAAAAVPAILQTVITQDMLAWTDVAVWESVPSTCTWVIEPHFAPASSRCSGVTRYEPAMGGRGTRMVMEGQFSIVADRLPGASLLLSGPTRRAIEAFVGDIVPRNFQQLSKAVTTFLGPG